MAKHVWLRKPSGKMTEEIFKAFEYALSIGATPDQAACATGYMFERRVQDSSRAGLGYIQSTASTGYRIMKGANSENYKLLVKNHKEYLTKLCINKLKLQEDTHWNIAMDFAQDNNHNTIYYLLGWLYGAEFDFVPLGSLPEKSKRPTRKYLPRSKLPIGTIVWRDDYWTNHPSGHMRRSPNQYTVIGYPKPNTWDNVRIRSNTLVSYEITVNDRDLFRSEEECQASIDKCYTTK